MGKSSKFLKFFNKIQPGRRRVTADDTGSGYNNDKLSPIFGVISLIISLNQISKMKRRRLHLDDKGYMYAKKEEETKEENKEEPKEEEEKVETLKYIFKDIFAILAPLLILIFNFVEDYYYYCASIVSLLLVLLSFKDLVNEHNLLVSNKIPQLEKRGGDEK